MKSSAAKKPLRNNYAAGGKVMPLIKSGSPQAVSANIKAEKASGAPQKQAVAIALETARRYGRAEGGRIGDERPRVAAERIPEMAAQQMTDPRAIQHPWSAPSLVGPAWARVLTDLVREGARRAGDGKNAGGRVGYAEGGIAQSSWANPFAPNPWSPPTQAPATPAQGAGTAQPAPSFSPSYTPPQMPNYSQPPMAQPAFQMPSMPSPFTQLMAMAGMNAPQQPVAPVMPTPAPASAPAPAPTQAASAPPTSAAPQMDMSSISKGMGYGAGYPSLGGMGMGMARGGRAGYAEGGWAGEMDTAPEPERGSLDRPWMGPRGDKSLADFARLLWGETTSDPSLPMSMTGLPSVAGGLGKLTDADPSTLHKLAGAGEIMSGAMPGLGMMRGPIGTLVAESTRTLPRSFATLGIPGALRVADEQGLASSAKAAEDQYQPPDERQIKSKAFVSGEQQRLKEKKLYGGDIDGKWGPGIESALKKEWEQNRKEERALALQEEQAKAAREAASAAANAAASTEAGRVAAAEQKTQADAARTKIREADEASPYAEALRKYAPWLGLLPGIYFGSKLAKHGDTKLTAGAQAEKDAAEALLKTPRRPKGAPKSYEMPASEKIGPLNEFYTLGQRQLPQAEREAAFLRDPNASRPPFWKVNPDAPQASALYPQPPKSREYALGAALPGLIGGGETGLGLGAGYYFGNQAVEAERAKAAPDASAADVYAADAAKKTAENREAIAEFFARMGMGTGFYGVGKSSYDSYLRPSMRPSTAKADKWYGDIAKELNKTKTQESAKASAKRAKKQEASGKAAQSKKPNGSNGAAPLVPLAASPVLLGSQSTEAPSPYASASEPLESPFAKGGEVKHWSHYQPRDKQQRFSGGPVYDKPNAASRASKGNASRTESGSFKRGGAVDSALSIARRYDSGGKVNKEPRYPVVMPEEFDRVEPPIMPHARAFGAGVIDPMGIPSWIANRVAATPGTDWYERRIQEARDESPMAAGIGSTVLPALLGLGGLRAAGKLTTKEALSAFPLAMQLGAGVSGVKDAITTPPRKTRAQAAYPTGGAYARGGKVTVGPVVGKTGGRTDALPVDVPAGAYVIPADAVGALGEGNTLAGMHKLTKSFGKSAPRKRADGGAVPIMISDGEYVVAPDQVAKLGHGDMDQGHRVLDALVKKIRAEHVRTLQQLPPPAT